MESYTILALFCAALSLLALVIAVFVLGRMRHRYDRFEKTVNNMISPQRDYIETSIYNSGSPLINDPGFFADANHILFDLKSDGSLHFSRQLPDFSFFENMGISLKDIVINEKMVACLMPFNKRFDKVKRAIADASSQAGYEFRRSDDELIEDNDNLRRSIVRMILEARVVVAVLDGRNPNVFYEIGIAQSMGKLVLMVANLNRDEYQVSGRKQPTDLLSNRLLTYNNPNDLTNKLVNTLKALQHDNGREEDTNS